MKMKLLALALLTFVSSAQAAERLPELVKSLTLPTVLVRSGVSTCAKGADLEAMAGGQLEALFAEKIGAFAKTKAHGKAWSKIASKDCVKDCSCSALEKIHEGFADPKPSGIEAVSEKLEKMTDEDYKACQKKVKNFCKQPEVTKFVKMLKNAGR